MVIYVETNQKWVETCHICQQHNTNTEEDKGGFPLYQSQQATLSLWLLSIASQK